MANDLAVNPMRVDTAAATILFANPIKIKSIRVTNEGVIGAGDAFEVQDSASKTLFKGDAAGDNFNEEVLIERWWKHGFKVTTLTAPLVMFITYE